MKHKPTDIVKEIHNKKGAIDYHILYIDENHVR
jgi:hypothetical protein